MGSWDKGVDYVYAYNLLLRLIGKVGGKSKCYLAIALIQLRNGSRVSESIRAFKTWVSTGDHEIRVVVSKKRNKQETRLMVIPRELGDLRLKCLELASVEDFKLKKRVQTTLYRYTGLNTHSLRYAYITFLLKEGVNPAIVSKLIHHSKLETLLHYVQERAGEQVLKEIY